jgi:hypothetical protein
MSINMSRKLKIEYHPADRETKTEKEGVTQYAIEKADSEGRKRRYLCGISSGMAIDHHGERMSKECIDDFQTQAVDNDIPLLVNHGKDFTEDVGILTTSEITKEYDWYTEYRLFDEYDLQDNPGLEQNVKEANVVWAKAAGLPPYRRPKQFGFSIEGWVDDNNKQATATGTVINKVDLDPGVTLVSRPAYKTSVAHAIAKAFPKEENIAKDLTGEKTDKSVFSDIIVQDAAREDFFEVLADLEAKKDLAIEKILSSMESNERKQEMIIDSLNDYRDMLTELYASGGFVAINSPEIPEESYDTDLDWSEDFNKPAEFKSQLAKVFPEFSQKVQGFMSAIHKGEITMDGNQKVADLFAQIAGLMQEMNAMMSGAEGSSSTEEIPPEMEPTEMAAAEVPPEKPKEDENDMKSVKEVADGSAGPAGAKPAEELVSEESQTTQPTDSEVSQAMKTVGQLAETVGQLATMQKASIEQVFEIKKGLQGIYDGLGITSAIDHYAKEMGDGNAAAPVQKGLNGQPGNLDQVNKALQDLLAVTGGGQVQTQKSTQTLREMNGENVMKGLWGK